MYDDLIKTLEAATEGGVQLDCLIADALNQPPFPWTTNTDNAVRLLPAGWWAEIHARPDQPSCRLFEFCMPCRKVPDPPYVIVGANTAIAVCIAALCALRLSPRGPGGGR